MFSRRKLLKAAGAASLLLPRKSFAWTHGAPTTLSDLIGYVPANFNMLPWGLNWSYTQFNDAAFTKTRSSISTGFVSPTGNTTAQKLVENNAGSTHFVTAVDTPQTSTVCPINFEVAVMAKAGERTRIVIEQVSFEDANASFSIGVDLAGGNIGYDNVIGSNFTLVSAAMTSLGNGWWLIKIVFNYNISPTNAANVWEPKIYLDSGSGTAARSISYAGDGSSGAYLWWFNQLPLACWNLTNLVFQDDFDSLNTIDLTDSGAPGFKWYVHNKAPNSFMTTFGWTTNPPSAPTPSANLSISSPSVLKIYNPNTNQMGFTSQIWSVYMPDGGGYVGSAFAPPLVYDGLFNWDGTTAGHSANWTGNPAFWGSTTDALTGTPSSGRFLEWDVMEALPVSSDVGASSQKHDWSNPSSPTSFNMGAGTMGLKMVLGTFQRLSGIWLPIDASGWGIFLSFTNGQFVFNSDAPYSATAAPLQVPGGIVGQFSEADSQLMPVFLNTAENVTVNAGGGWAMYIDWIKIYSKP